MASHLILLGSTILSLAMVGYKFWSLLNVGRKHPPPFLSHQHTQALREGREAAVILQQQKMLRYKQRQQQREEKRQIVPVETDDLIYREKRLSPIVLEQHKLIFFDVPKVASTTWLRLFQRLEDVSSKKSFPDDLGRELNCLHEPDCNNLQYLYQIKNLTRVTEIMNDPTWTRATFSRNPHERLLSAYLDKGVRTNFKWLQAVCCHWDSETSAKIGKVHCMNKLINNHTFPHFVDFVESHCRNDHWSPQTARMDHKHWPLINFVGNTDSMERDSKALLERIGVGGDSASALLQQLGAKQQHSSSASDLVGKYYNSPSLYQQVSLYYRDDYGNRYLNLPESAVTAGILEHHIVVDV